MKIERRATIPFRPKDRSLEALPPIDDLGAEDSDKILKLIEENKIEELNDLINNRTVDHELATKHTPGLFTRDYLSSALGKGIAKANPEIEILATRSRPQDAVEMTKRLRDVAYPKLEQAQKSFGLKPNITSVDAVGNQYNPANGQINILPSSGYPYNKIVSALHELGHATDDISRKTSDFDTPEQRASFEEMVASKKGNAIYEDARTSDHRTSNTEVADRNLIATPNFEDYNYETGDFNSDYTREPLELQKEISGEHHIKRNFPYDNLFNFQKEGLPGVVESSPKFQNVLNKLRGKA